MNTVCGFLLYYFPKLNGMLSTGYCTYHTCVDKILSTVTYSHECEYVIFTDIIIQNWTLPDNLVIGLMYM